MVCTQIQFPEPLYRRLKAIAERNDWPLAEVVRRATELCVRRFTDVEVARSQWSSPTLDAHGDYLVDPADVDAEAEAVDGRSR